jgi:hypothetical protein
MVVVGERVLNHNTGSRDMKWMTKRQMFDTISTEYNRRVVENTDAEWNAAVACLWDNDGTVVYELLDTAASMGFTLTETQAHELYELWNESHRGELSATARLFPATNGEW